MSYKVYERDFSELNMLNVLSIFKEEINVPNYLNFKMTVVSCMKPKLVSICPSQNVSPLLSVALLIVYTKPHTELSVLLI